MADHFPCPFHLALITGAHGCARALPITRRAGPDIACASDTAHIRCSRAFDYIKRAAQPVLGFPDNLQDAPHSMTVKLQNGGVTGLQKLLEPTAHAASNIDALIDDLTRKFGSLEHAPYNAIVATIRDFKITRGAGKRGG